MSSWGVIFGIILVIFIIIILVLAFSMPTNEIIVEPSAIRSSQMASLLPNGNYSIPSKYNRANVVIPALNNKDTIINFEVDSSKVHIGDLFTIDNSNNPLNTFKVIYTGFDNNQSSDKTDEVTINNGLGILNTVLIQITAGKSNNTHNIIITASPMYLP